MEEKERYTIESFEIEEPSVIFDNKTNQIILTLVDYNYDEITHLKDLLNHYFKRIKELEEENKKLIKALNGDIFINYKVPMENAKLKQQLHDLPKKIVREIKKELYDCGRTYLEDEPYIEICIVQGILDTILKKFGGEDESNND